MWFGIFPDLPLFYLTCPIGKDCLCIHVYRKCDLFPLKKMLKFEKFFFVKCNEFIFIKIDMETKFFQGHKNCFYLFDVHPLNQLKTYSKPYYKTNTT